MAVSLIVEQLQQNPYRALLLDRMPQWRLRVNDVPISPADPFRRYTTFRLQIRDDSLRGALSDTNLLRHIPQPDVSIARKADEYVRMIGQERPRLHRLLHDPQNTSFNMR